MLDAFPQVPRLALTATADKQTRADVMAQLGIPEDQQVDDAAVNMGASPTALAPCGTSLARLPNGIGLALRDP